MRVSSLLLAVMFLFCCTSPFPGDGVPEADTPQENVPEENVPGENVPGENVPEENVPGEEPEYLDWETAEVAVANMGVGWNLGNTLDSHDAKGGRGDDWLYWETYWGQCKTRPELMSMMKQAGFGAIRVPVTWGIHLDSDDKVYDAWMGRVRTIVDYVLDAGMYCIINVHHDTGAGDGVWLVAGMDEYRKEKERFASLWTQIAKEFKDYDHRLLFESYNEMLDSRRSWCYASFNGGYDSAFAADAYDAINSYAQAFVDAVRATGGNNAVRNLIVNTYGACSGSGNWNEHLKDPLKEMELPEDTVKDHLIFEVHSYPSVDDYKSMTLEVDDMFNALHTHLASKGAPVIVGEWGTSSKAPAEENMLRFIDYFVKKANDYDMGTFFWMGLSDGISRTIPCFNEPRYAEAILKAYHGEGYQPVLPVIDDFDCTYTVTYTSQWGELHLSNSSISLDEYSAVYLMLDSVPASGKLAIKVYGEGDKTHYNHISQKEVTIPLDRTKVGDISTRITLQYMQSGTYSISVKRAALIRKDGTYVTTNLSPFWGCDLELKAVPK